MSTLSTRSIVLGSPKSPEPTPRGGVGRFTGEEGRWRSVSWRSTAERRLSSA
jgi:hypothetical protein